MIDIQALRIILGMPFLLFFPGYALVAALYPNKTEITGFERFAFSVGLSIAIVPLTGLILNHTWEIDILPILVALTTFIAIMSGTGWYRRRGIPDDEKLDISFNLVLPWGRCLDKILTFAIAVALVGTIVVFVYVITTPKEAEKYTEFYLLGLEGNTDLYPREIVLNQNGEISLVRYLDAVRHETFLWRYTDAVVEVEDEVARVYAGIVSHESQMTSCIVQMYANETLIKEIGPIELAPEEKWEAEIGFTLHEICGTTTIVENTNSGIDPSPIEYEYLRVQSTEYLEPDDYIQIENELAQIQSVDSNILVLKEGLQSYYPAETQITEIQKVEFRLYRMYHLGKDEGRNTSCALWCGKENLSAMVINDGQIEANYEVKVATEGVETDLIQSKVVSPGEEWAPEFGHTILETETKSLEFTLYRDGKLLHKEKTSNDDPSIHLWINVKEGTIDI
ncbi:MAG: DUF1616 domain-containing protein [bacterium]|nr:DUF1616 domain-containing protein [bacterium]